MQQMEGREGCSSGVKVTSVCLCTSVRGGARFDRSETEDEICSKCQAEMSVAKLLQRAQSIRGVRLLHTLGVILTTTLRLSTFHSLSFYLEALFCIFNATLGLFSLEFV